MTSRIIDNRFSTYSGAPSLQPSLAPTLESTIARSIMTNTQRNTATFSYLDVPIDEKSPTTFYGLTDSAAAASSSTLSNSSDPKTVEIRSWSKGFERMQDERLDKQRYVMSGNKSEEVSKLALGAKLERALGRRMTGQDAVFSNKTKQQQQQRREPAQKRQGAYEVEVR